VNEHFRLNDERERNRQQREEDDSVSRDVHKAQPRVLTQLRGESVPSREDGEGKENKVNV
jgi:hypothetical protein